MSMVVTCSTLINDISAFKRMLNDRNIKYQENVNMNVADGGTRKVDLYIADKNIGLVKGSDGNYTAVMGRGTNSRAAAEELSHDYTVTMVKLAAAQRGIPLNASDITKDKNGNTVIKLRNVVIQ